MYYKSYTDKNGYIYSIDNFVIEYRLKIGSLEKVTESIKFLSEKYKDSKDEYWERLNCPLCSKYQYYDNHVHLRNGIYIMIGKWVLMDDKKDRIKFPLVKLDINPNKYADNIIFKDLIDMIKPDIGDWYIKRFDLAIDIKTVPDNVQVFRSRKEKGLYKGTRYFGTHNSNGFCKIYNKQIESKLDFELTRIEHTIKLSEKRQNIDNMLKVFSLEDVYIKSSDDNKCNLSKLPYAFKELYIRAKDAGINTDDIIDLLDKRMKSQIFEAVSGTHYKKLIYDYDIIKNLINDMIDLFTVPAPIFENDKGFLELSSDIDLPFD